MHNLNSIVESSFGLEKIQDSYEIIYADRRDKEIQLKIVKSSQLNAHMARWSYDLTYKHLLWSDGVYEILEIDSKKINANFSSFLQVIHPDDRPIKEKTQKALFNENNIIEITYRLQMDDGRIKWVNEICSSDFDQNGNPIRIYGIIQDITRFKLAEIKFLQKEEDYKVLLNLLPVGIITYQNNLITFVNPEGGHILGASEVYEIIGQPISKFVDVDELNLFHNKMDDEDLGIASKTFEARLIRINGSVFDAIITSVYRCIDNKLAVQLIIFDDSKNKIK